MGLTRDEVQDMNSFELERLQRTIAKRLETAGAHFVIADIGPLPPVIEDITQLLAEGMLPDDYLSPSQAVQSDNLSRLATEADPCSP